jgi:hypothetical protein
MESVVRSNQPMGPCLVADRLMRLRSHVFTYIVAHRTNDAEADPVASLQENLSPCEIEIEIDIRRDRRAIFASVGILESKYRIYELLFLTADEDVFCLQSTVLATIVLYWQGLDGHSELNAFCGISRIRKCSQVYAAEIFLLKKRFPLLGLPWLESLLYMKFAKCNGCVPPVWIDNHAYYAGPEMMSIIDYFSNAHVMGERLAGTSCVGGTILTPVVFDDVPDVVDCRDSAPTLLDNLLYEMVDDEVESVWSRPMS